MFVFSRRAAIGDGM